MQPVASEIRAHAAKGGKARVMEDNARRGSHSTCHTTGRDVPLSYCQLTWQRLIRNLILHASKEASNLHVCLRKATRYRYLKIILYYQLGLLGFSGARHIEATKKLTRKELFAILNSVAATTKGICTPRLYSNQTSCFRRFRTSRVYKFRWEIRK